jgi:D-hydroxyproline dehydrogenase subunit beta
VTLPQTADLVVIGAGAVGAACAYFAARAGLRVVVLDRGPVAGGTSSAGEGNLLLSDKEPGPELDLALLSHRVWTHDLAEHGRHWEYEAKGGLVVSDTDAGRGALEAFAVHQRAAGIEGVRVGADELPDYEPFLTREVAGGVFYPQDAQVQPMLLTAHLLRLARGLGAQVITGSAVTGFLRDGDAVTGVRAATGQVSAPAVLNAAGTWSGEVARLVGVHLPVLPRRGFVLVTQPLPPVVRHKVYGASYVADVASSDEALQTSPVVEGTPSGTVLIGASRERVGFDRTPSLRVLARLAAAAGQLFPVLRDASLIRAYAGFRPYCPDHLPVVGPDPRAPGLWHACGHEGAGIGLSVGTGSVLATALTGGPPEIDLHPFRPERFDVSTNHPDEELAGAR